MFTPLPTSSPRTSRQEWYALAKRRARYHAEQRRAGKRYSAGDEIVVGCRLSTYEVLGYPER